MSDAGDKVAPSAEVTAEVVAANTAVPSDPFRRLRQATPARVALGRCGHGLPTSALLSFQADHARARDAVHEAFEAERVVSALVAPSGTCRTPPLVVHSRAPDRQTYLQRPDLGRMLSDSSAQTLKEARGDYEVGFVIADGLSATAVHHHAVPFLQVVLSKIPDWRTAPVVIACQGRVALGDEVGACLGTSLLAVLIGERPGLSSPDSLGVYLTWQPRPGRQDSERNCISNIRPPVGLSYLAAADKLVWLMQAARQQRVTGVGLKDESNHALHTVVDLPQPSPGTRY